MALALAFKDFIDGNQDTGFFYIAKSIVDGCAKEFHGWRQTHVGIYQWWNVIPHLTNLAVQYQIVLLEGIAIEQLFQLVYIGFQFQRFQRNNQLLFVVKVLSQEVKDHVTSLPDVGGVHGHLAEVVFDVGANDGNGSQSVP